MGSGNALRGADGGIGTFCAVDLLDTLGCNPLFLLQFFAISSPGAEVECLTCTEREISEPRRNDACWFCRDQSETAAPETIELGRFLERSVEPHIVDEPDGTDFDCEQHDRAIGNRIGKDFERIGIGDRDVLDCRIFLGLNDILSGVSEVFYGS